MVKRASNRKQADTSPTKEVVVNSLTKDATTEACLFDLVDNAIDGAREHLENTSAVAKETGLPLSYSGFHVHISVDASSVTVSDNSGGISASDIETRVLRFGARSKKPHGIGFYGVGLNRAMFKLGKMIKIETDDGKNSSSINLDVEDYLSKKSWKNEFEVNPAGKIRGTKIVISNPAPEISHELSDPEWQSSARENLARRYHQFLLKGLEIKFQGKAIIPTFVEIRDDSPFPKLEKYYKSDDDVWVHIEAGQHVSHRFAAESNAANGANPKELTKDYGWSVLCNDRQILAADRTEKTGWEPTWHGEYNGFVGRIHFISRSPDSLPWNTSKTDVDRGNVHYREALDDMKAFTNKWRQYARLAKNAKKHGTPLPVPKKPQVVPKKRQPSKASGTHERTVLDADTNEVGCKAKLLELVREGKRIDFYENRYTGLSLLRIVFEVSFIHFVKKKNIFAACWNWCVAFEEGARGKPFAASHKKAYMPGLSTLLEYLTAEWVTVMGTAAPYLVTTFENFKRYKRDMDDAIHHPFNEADPLRAVAIRDAVNPLLRAFIES